MEKATQSEVGTTRRKVDTKQRKRILNGGIASAASGKRQVTSAMESYGGPHDVKVKARAKVAQTKIEIT
jgi:hypothetical protein